jgi:hypothetical protein
MESDQSTQNQNVQGVQPTQSQTPTQQSQAQGTQNQPPNPQQPQTASIPIQTPNPQQPTPVAPEPPPNPKTKESNLILKIGVIILVISILIGAVSFFLRNRKQEPNDKGGNTTPIPNQNINQLPSPTPDPTANWKMTATKYYTIKYPNGLDLKAEEEDVLVLSKWGPTQTEETELFDGYSIALKTDETSQTPEEYADVLIEEIKDLETAKITKDLEPITINDYEGVTFTEEGLGTYENIILGSDKSSVLILITVIVSDPGNLGFQETVDQILSTLEFISGV